MVPTVHPAEREKLLTSIQSSNKRAGFTLIELSVVILLVAMFAALVVPRLVAFQKGEEYRNFVSRLKSSFAEARESAIVSKAIVRLRVNDGQRQVELVNGGTEDDGQVSRTLQMPDGVEVSKATLEGTETSTETWEIAFYPDGSASKGGVEFSSDGQYFSMQVDDVTGKATFIDDVLPEDVDSKWEAGEREQRGG